MKKKLALPALTVQFVSVAASTRIPLMMNGTIDLECGNTTNTVERQQHVAFSPTIFVAANRLLSKKVQHQVRGGLDGPSPQVFLQSIFLNTGTSCLTSSSPHRRFPPSPSLEAHLHFRSGACSA
ncbi:transporter substrate-binding domain-containing protein [Janthinobacterium sp. CG_23.3]|uniref:transporter substrate-binding domain-containing protein n=1 Tax=Janthinobacterium sp. CG_23.3 TaxID=3349634 RepID=UPI0038D459A7